MIRSERAALVLIGIGAALLAGCGGAGTASLDERVPLPVRIAVVRSGPPAGEIILPGRVEAREEVTIFSRVAGRVTGLPVSEGGSFREGDVLARFDAPEAREGLAAAEAGWTAARARLDLAKRQEARFESLYAAKVVALHELELVRAELQTAAAAERSAAAASSDRRAAVEIRAPFSGIVVRRRVDPGSEAAPGAALLDIRSRESGLVVAAVPEREAGRLGAAPAAIQIDDAPWNEAVLVRADGMVDPVSRTRTARFRPRLGGTLPAGAFARVRLGEPRLGSGPAGLALTLPESALVRRGALNGVYVVRDGRASLRWLRLGGPAGGEVEVLAGLDPGDSVALAPAGLDDGRRVVPAK